MVKVVIWVSEGGEKAEGVCLQFEVDGWKPSGCVNDIDVRRHLLGIIEQCRPLLKAALAEDVALEQVVGVPFGCDLSCTELWISYRTPVLEQFAADHLSAVSPFPLPLSPVRTVSSRFGPVPTLPPLQVLGGARPFFTTPLLKLLKPVSEVFQEWSGDVGELWHYSRFAWNELRDSWCKTHVFYSSPDPTGPLSLYPLHKEDKTLAEGSPDGNSDFVPHYVKCVLDQDALLRDDGCMLLSLEDLVGTLTPLLVHPEWRTFAALCERHGMVRPDPELLLDVGLEKAMIPVTHFFPFAPVSGFSYSHIFSSVPEPKTVCLVASAASRWLKPKLGTEHASWLLAVARACAGEKSITGLPLPESGVRQLFDGVPEPQLRGLLAARLSQLPEGSPLCEYTREAVNKAALKVALSRALLTDSLAVAAEAVLKS